MLSNQKEEQRKGLAGRYLHFCSYPFDRSRKQDSGFYWASYRYDNVLIFEALPEKATTESSIEVADIVASKMGVAAPQ